MTTPLFRKDFTQDRDIHVGNFRQLEDFLDAPVDATGGAFRNLITIGEPAGRHLDLGPQTVDGIDYFIIAWEADVITTALLADGTWT